MYPLQNHGHQDYRALCGSCSSDEQDLEKQKHKCCFTKQTQYIPHDCDQQDWFAKQVLSYQINTTTCHAELKCWAFSPPGGLVSRSLLSWSEHWCTSVVVGKDAVPRLTLNNVSRLMDEMVTSLARCRSVQQHNYTHQSTFVYQQHTWCIYLLLEEWKLTKFILGPCMHE